MKIAALHRFFFCSFVATALTLSAFAQSQAGRITASKVEGQVTRTAADGSSSAVTNGQALTETDVITTGKNSGIVLIFENNSSVKLGPESRLEIEKFTLDPFDGPPPTGKEPSVSTTALNLSYGEMIGKVEKLNTAGGSTYNIKTPVGAAGIRGTVYRIVFKPDANGKAFFQVQTQEGSVVFSTASGNSGANAAAQEVPVDAGKEISITLDVPTGGGQTYTVPPLVSTELPAESIAAIQSAVQTIVEAVQQTVVPPSTPPPSTPAETTTTETQQQQPVPIQVTTPALTPGAGK